MTVSPNELPHGRRPESKANEALSAANRASSKLPPTLFELPNLRDSNPAKVNRDHSALMMGELGESRSVAKTPPAETPPANPSDAPAVALKTSPDTLNANTSATDAAPTPAHSGTQSCHAVNHVEQDNRNPEPQAKEDLPPAPEIPAGRNWMEIIGSHSVVLAMLIIVVITALVVGKRSQDRSRQATPVQQQTDDSMTIEGLISQGEPINQQAHLADANESLETLPSADETNVNRSLPSVFASRKVASNGPGNQSSNATQSSLSLASHEERNSTANRDAAENSQQQTSSDTDQPSSDDELTSSKPADHKTAASPTNDAANTDEYPATKTPVAIGNWEQYLPPVPSDADATQGP